MRCIACNEIKAPEDFYPATRGYEWRNQPCKECHRERSRLAVNRRRAMQRGECVDG